MVSQKMVLFIFDWIRYNLNSDNGHAILFQELDVFLRCDMAFIEPMHRNKPNITYLLDVFLQENEFVYIIRG